MRGGRLLGGRGGVVRFATSEIERRYEQRQLCPDDKNCFELNLKNNATQPDASLVSAPTSPHSALFMWQNATSYLAKLRGAVTPPSEGPECLSKSCGPPQHCGVLKGPARDGGDSSRKYQAIISPASVQESIKPLSPLYSHFSFNTQRHTQGEDLRAAAVQSFSLFQQWTGYSSIGWRRPWLSGPGKRGHVPYRQTFFSLYDTYCRGDLQKNCPVNL
ncbi:hypothetical protein RRG08_052556 [Elysia crispata]|uniref:Uncharacterized protein n=1 Tax=Elysia crispata TaxID=231223 RepID=A0AAE0Z6M9_9GAST|nr:hypothetical protein RRG08_052556 [Elysia crispata]